MACRPRDLKAVLWSRLTDAAGVTVPCHWCGVSLSYADATADHEPALAEGGKPMSAVISCHSCNQRRGKETNDRVKAKRGRKGRG